MEQGYRTEPSNEDIVLGNDALMKCKIPSYVADMVEVVGWVNSEAAEYRVNNNYGKFIETITILIGHHAVGRNYSQNFCLVMNGDLYEIDVYREYVTIFNDALLKCQIPSHIGDLVFLQNWEDNLGNFFFSGPGGYYGKQKMHES